MSKTLYLEDLAPGQVYGGSGRATVTAAAIMEFARAFDPQDFHLSEEQAQRTAFKGLAASGWHTASLTMRLMVESDFTPGGRILGAGAENLSWPRPVRPGDELRVESEILEVRQSKSKPDQGIARVRVTTLNQNSETVQELVAVLVVPKRPR